MLVTILSPLQIRGATDGAGNRLPVSLAQEDGLTSASVLVVVPSGATQVVRFDLEGAVAPGTRYDLDVGHQATRVPDQVDVSVTGNGGWKVVGRRSAEVRDDGPAHLSFTLAQR
jgi:hypothetical protein